MIKHINKGMHYSLNFLNFKPYFNKNVLCKKYNVCFYSSCKYDIDEDQSDINKLFGFSYGFHHKQSDRIGWRYNKNSNKIELFLYSYENGNRIKSYLTDVDLYQPVDIELEIYLSGKYRYVSASINKVVYSRCLLYNKKHWGYTLGLYFGGNRRAPHKMEIRIR